jgi:(2Fe-2S) ferredoxin
MNEWERKLIERIRESDEARKIVEEFIKGDRCPEESREPFAPLESSFSRP